jgi:hypothetical protein
MGPFARFIGGFLIRLMRQVPKGHIASWASASGRGIKLAKLAEGSAGIWMAYEILDMLSTGPSLADLWKPKPEEEYKAMASRAGLNPDAALTTISRPPDVWAGEIAKSMTTEQVVIDGIVSSMRAMMAEVEAGGFGTDEDKVRGRAPGTMGAAQGCDSYGGAEHLRQLTMQTERAASALGVPFGRMPALVDDLRALLASSPSELLLIATVRGVR